MRLWQLVLAAMLLQACASKEETTGSFVARVNLDMTRGAAKFENDPINRRALALDRQVKLAAFTSDPGYRTEYQKGDSDGDLVPDARDRCPNTPQLTPTDSEGCEYDCNDLSHTKSRLVTREQCASLIPPPSGHRQGSPDDIAFPINLKCVGAKTPSTSAPLGWAHVVVESGILSSGPVIERSFKVAGLKFFVTRVPQANPACELFYEFDMRISSGGTVQSTNMLFSAREDTGRTNPDIAAFTIKTYRDESERALQPGAPISLNASRAALPLSPGRAKARDAVTASAEILWRVRAVDGMGHAASWSEYRRYKAGPDMTL